ncbi:hypothetical protein PFICI_14667 [Pestalotiopsis fici W106-1]|uniref:NmrA-like domain-containing protein n=1 Tax=Pestalotiopsis fici (strain W106-1 / CGMCC3.15140) TaxID=1229662 RepID=W3WLQ1_PESFW|nr:uncharacterized protein PFICI_14667 [Pestalotiopsis fici W106-1]ETS73721.1 hypothetical protein PFICI_14667 [Pestalotiopsis fici W106-1]
MRNVAVAGGTGRLGLTIVKALKQSEHNVIVLSRRSSPNPRVAPTIHVDYSNVESLQKVLHDHNIDTVISTMSLFTEAEGVAQLNLIAAAENCQNTQRFVPSEWSIPLRKDHVDSLPSLQARLQAVEALKRSGLEFTLFYPGWFMDFYGLPHIESEMGPFPFAVDIENKAAVIPGSGNVPVVFTYTPDIAKMVVASLDLEKWPEHSYIIGDKMTFNELLALVEEVKGSVCYTLFSVTFHDAFSNQFDTSQTGGKFSVSYNTIAEMKSGKIVELPAQKECYNDENGKENFQKLVVAYAVYVEAGDFDFPAAATLNATLPDVRTMSVKEFLYNAWGSK